MRFSSSLLEAIFLPSKADGVMCIDDPRATDNEAGQKMAPALRVAVEYTPSSVTRRSLGVTKTRSLRLGWRVFNHNSDDAKCTNRPLPC